MKSNFCKILLGILCGWVMLCAGFEPAAAAELSVYEQAKVELDRLRNDERRARYRHEWLKCADSFMNVYERNPDWNNRPAALFRSAEALEEMARRSFVRKDAQDSASRFELLAREHPASVLADDALYRSAVIRHELMRDSDDAKALLSIIQQKYSRSDFAPAAAEFMASINSTKVASLAPAAGAMPKSTSGLALISQVTAQLKTNSVRIVVSLDRPASWRLKYQAPDRQNGRLPQLALTLGGSGPDKNLKTAANFSDMGILTKEDVEYSAADNNTKILFSFSDLYRYTVKAERSPFRIIIEATAKTDVLSGGVTVKDSASGAAAAASPARPASTAPAPRTVAPSNLAAQLGMTVKTIIIDPGHGGKDPGAMHNGIVEREVALDVARRLANVLRSAGYKVILTRDKDVFLPLSERASFAAANQGDLFISIHVNANRQDGKSGFETYYLDMNGSRDAIQLAALENSGASRRLGEMEEILTDLVLSSRVQESRRLAAAVQDKALARLRRSGHSPVNGGTRGALFHVLLGSSMPGVLVEIGYCSNQTEARLLGQSKYRDSIAEGIANGIHHYAQQLATAAK